MDGAWEDDADCQLLRLNLDASFVDRGASELGRDPSTLGLTARLPLRDPRIEALGWAIKADLAAQQPSDRLYVDHLASALAVRLIETCAGDVDALALLRIDALQGKYRALRDQRQNNQRRHA